MTALLNKTVLFFLVSVAALGAIPVILPPFMLYLFNEILIFALFSYGFYLLFSYAGYLSFGQAAFFAIGGYTAALMFRHYTEIIWIPYLSALAIGITVAFIIGYLCFRLHALYFAFITMGFAQMIYVLIFSWDSLTGGDDGIPGVARGVMDFVFIKV